MIPAAEFSGRRARLALELPSSKLDALVVSAAVNVRYLTGFTGSSALLLVWPGGATLFTDPRYGIQAREECGCPVRVVRGPLYPALVQAAARRKLRRLGFESARITHDVYERLRAELGLGASLHPVTGLVERQRVVKSPSELAVIRRSVLANSQAYERALRKLRPGMTETALAAEIEHQMRRLGAERPAFDSIVASGSHSALPHANPRDVAIEPGRLLLVDIGCSLEGYSSDMTRMAFLGSAPPKARRMYRAVLEAQLAAIDAVRPGVEAGKVDRAARRALRGYGMERLFLHSTGHGLGLEIHEPPRVGKRERTLLQAGMAITIEPGVYVEGYGGIRIEDTVVVTENGCEVLTPTSKALRELA